MTAPPVTDQQLRDAGFAPASRSFPRSERATRWIAEFNGIPFDRVPAAWWYASNEYMRQYVEEKVNGSDGTRSPGDETV